MTEHATFEDMTQDILREKIHRIVREGVCSGCGLCEAIAGPDRITVETVAVTGYGRPVVKGPLTHEIVDRIYDVCPATRWDGLPDRLVEADTEIDGTWGPVRSMSLAHAADPEVRYKAATGGVLTALSMFLVDSGEVDFVLHASAAASDPSYGDPLISKDAASVRRGSGSVYAPTAPLRLAEEALSRGRPFAFVGKPCDIAPLRNLARFDPRVDELVKYWLAPVCGGWTPPTTIDDFLANYGVHRSELTFFTHRGDGCPGRVEFTTHDGRQFDAHMYEAFGGLEEANWQIPFRCKLCPGGTAEACDIAAGDQWEDAKPDPVFELTDPGTNAVIVRTAAGADLYRRAVEAGYINIEDEITPRWYDTRQPHQVNKKRVMRARWDALAAEGRLVARSQGLRLESESAKLSEEMRIEEYEGTRKRLRAGAADEPDPVPGSSSPLPAA